MYKTFLKQNYVPCSSIAWLSAMPFCWMCKGVWLRYPRYNLKIFWLVFGNYGISTFIGYLMPNSGFIYVKLKISKCECFIDNILDKRGLICLHTIKWFQFIVFFGTNLSQKGQKVIHVDVSNWSLKLFTLKNHFLTRAKALHSMRTCLTVEDIWHVKHFVFSSRSLKLFTLKNHFLISAKALHSMKTCLTVEVIWHVKHWGFCFFLSIKECVSFVWPICYRI